jgi:hypothetical protein
MNNAKRIAPGSRVKLSGKFLKSTGLGRYAGLSFWTVQECTCDLCTSGRFVCTNEKLDAAYVASMWTPAELAAQPSLALRHFNSGNLVKVAS